MKEKAESFNYPPGLHKERVAHETTELANTVIWENKKLHAPFNIEVGKPSPLGLMFEVAPNADRPEGLSLKTRLWFHGRSADIGAVYFNDDEGNLYRDVDVKGAGKVSVFGFPEEWNHREKSSDHRVEGLMNKEDAMHDSEIAELFSNFGIRTHRSLAVIELHELAKSDKKTGNAITMSLDELRKNGHLPENFYPVVQVRAFGTKTRLIDIKKFGAVREEVEDTISLVSRETKESVKDIESYIDWFAKTLGTNVGRMHANGYTHAYLTLHNITLDCRLVDFDSVEKRSEDDTDPEIPEYASIEEEIEAEPLPSVFWGKASNDYYKAAASLQDYLLLLKREFRELRSVDQDELLIVYEEGYLAANPKANTFLWDM